MGLASGANRESYLSKGLSAAQLRELIHEVPDYPKAGINFLDITPLLADALSFAALVKLMAEPWQDKGVSHVIGIEARGFVLAAPIALELGAGVVPARKVGKLPRQTHVAAYELEYGSAALEVHIDAVPPHGRVLIVDDVLATGGTMAATIELANKLGCEVVGAAVLLEIKALGGRSKIGSTDLTVALP